MVFILKQEDTSKENWSGTGLALAHACAQRSHNLKVEHRGRRRGGGMLKEEEEEEEGEPGAQSADGERRGAPSSPCAPPDVRVRGPHTHTWPVRCRASAEG